MIEIVILDDGLEEGGEGGCCLGVEGEEGFVY